MTNLARNLIGLATLKRQAYADFDTAMKLIREGNQLLCNMKEYSLKVRCLCELGHIQIANHEDCSETLKTVQTMISEFRLQEDQAMIEVWEKLKKPI